MGKARVLVTCHHLLRHIEIYKPQFVERDISLTLPEPKGQQFSSKDMQELITGCDVVIAGDDVIDREVLEAGKQDRLQTVIKWGIGTDNIDKTAAQELGISIMNTPGAFSDEVAEAAWCFILMLARGYHLMHQSILEGEWLKIEGRSLTGLTLGAVGMGAIGQAILRRGKAFGMNAIGYDPAQIEPRDLKAINTKQVGIDAVLSQADILVLSCNLTPENHHLINATSLAAMKPQSYLINVARGPLVNEADLYLSLKSGHIAGAALDVFEVEPLPKKSPLRTLQNCVFGTHNGSNTKEAVERVNRLTVDMALQVING